MMQAYLMSVNDWTDKFHHLPPGIQNKTRGQFQDAAQKLTQVYQSPILSERLDALYELVNTCITQMKDPLLPRGYRKEIKLLYLEAIKISGCLVNETEQLKIMSCLKTRAHYRAVDPDFIPRTLPPTAYDPTRNQGKDYAAYKVAKDEANKAANHTLGLTEHGREKDQRCDLTYFYQDRDEKIEREKRRLLPYNGKLVKLKQSPGDPLAAALRIENFTSTPDDPQYTRTGIFVVTAQGDIYEDNKIDKVVHHSSFDPNPVFFAGTLKVQDGTIVKINNLSGHYQPKEQHLVAMKSYFRKAGIIDRNVDLQLGAKHAWQLRPYEARNNEEIYQDSLLELARKEQSRLSWWSLFSSTGRYKKQVWHNLEERILDAQENKKPVTAKQIIADWENASVIGVEVGPRRRRTVKNISVLEANRSRFNCFKKDKSASLKHLESVIRKNEAREHDEPPIKPGGAAIAA